MEKRKMNQLVWFRNDLRINDHEPLLNASQHGPVLALYCFDPVWFGNTTFGFEKTGPVRAKFLIESVEALRARFREMGGDLVIRLGEPDRVISKLVNEHNIENIHYHMEITQEETDVEQAVKDAVEIPMNGLDGGFLYHPEDLPFELPDTPDVFTQFRKKVEKKSQIRNPLPVPEQIKFVQGVEPGEIPSFDDLGLTKSEQDHRTVLPFKGGEPEAWNRINHYFFESHSLKDYKYTRNGLLGADYSSKLSPWLANGSISARAVADQVRKFEKSVHKNMSTYWLIFELIWRDYFRYSALKYGHKLFSKGGIQEKQMEKSTNKDLFEKWANGETGIPFIDANMRELNATGYMSNRGRQNTASFLAQNLNLDWRMGAEYFESTLIDYDVCSNWGNWAYNATVGHDPRNRYFNIISQANKYDKDGEYVRRWLPELKNLPKEYIHEPFKMTPDQQMQYDVQIGNHYPEPVIDLEKSYQRIKDED